MILRKRYPPAPLQIPTPDATPQPSPSISECDGFDVAMNMSDEFNSRPASIATASTTYCPRMPTLHEVLANSAPPPWTLSAFMAYLSQNHCLETLEFTMDAERYRQSYDTVAAQMAGMPMSSDVEEAEYIRMLWQRLMDAYIVPGAQREVNLPSSVRDELTSLPAAVAAPNPDVLTDAVKMIYDLMEESIYMSFLNSVSQPQGHQSIPRSSSEDALLEVEQKHRRSLSRSRRRHSPTSLTPDLDGPFSPLSSRNSRPSSSNMQGLLGKPTAKLSMHNSNHSTGSGESALTDDSGASMSSPGREPMTPPVTPPSSDLGSPRNRADNTWKKMGVKLGWKKKSVGGLRDSRFPATEEEP